MTLQADKARKALNELPMRLPERVGQYVAGRAFVEAQRSRAAVKWLHEINGDPFKGRPKAEVRKELFGAEEAAADAARDATGPASLVATELDPKSEVKVTIEGPARRGMPLTYLDGLSDIEVRMNGQTVKQKVVALRWEVTGRHTAPLFGVSPTGTEVSIPGITWIVFDERRNPEGNVETWATDEWAVWDILALMRQIGATP